MPRTIFLVFSMIWINVLNIPFASAIHKCIDDSGNVTFSNVPCISGQTINGSNGLPEALYEVTRTRLNSESFEVSVKIEDRPTLLVPMPISWDYSTKYPEGITSPTLSINSKNGNSVVLQMSFSKIKDKSELLLHNTIDNIKNNLSNRFESEPVHSNELPLFYSEGNARKVIYKDHKLRKKRKSSKISYVFITAAAISVDDTLVSAIIYSNEVSSKNYGKALTALKSIAYNDISKKKFTRDLNDYSSQGRRAKINEPKEQEEPSFIEKSLILAYLSEGLSRGTMAKLHITERYMLEGAFPSSNYGAGLPIPTEITGQSLKSLRVSTGGIITLTFDEKTGVEDGMIKLVPQYKDSFTGITWACFTSSYKYISKILPQCHYK